MGERWLVWVGWSFGRSGPATEKAGLPTPQLKRTPHTNTNQKLIHPFLLFLFQLPYLRSRGIKVETLSKTAGDKKHPKYVIDYIKGNKIDVVINVPEGTKRDEEVTIGYVK